MEIQFWSFFSLTYLQMEVHAKQTDYFKLAATLGAQTVNGKAAISKIGLHQIM